MSGHEPAGAEAVRDRAAAAAAEPLARPAAGGRAGGDGSSGRRWRPRLPRWDALIAMLATSRSRRRPSSTATAGGRWRRWRQPMPHLPPACLPDERLRHRPLVQRPAAAGAAPGAAAPAGSASSTCPTRRGSATSRGSMSASASGPRPRRCWPAFEGRRARGPVASRRYGAAGRRPRGDAGRAAGDRRVLPGRHGLWLALGGAAPTFRDAEAFAAGQAAFEELPTDLRALLGPRFAGRLLDAGHPTEARIIQDTAVRRGTSPRRSSRSSRLG